MPLSASATSHCRIGHGLTSLTEFGDSYARKARIYPALLTVLPIGVTATGVFLKSPPWWGSIAALATFSGVFFFGAVVGRTRGKEKEESLFQSWGGPPST